MSLTRMLALALVVSGLVFLVAGCFLKREEGKNRTVLKEGWQCADDMAGWVALPPTPPKEVSGKVNYAVAATHNLVPEKMNGWYAMSPSLFEKASGIKVSGAPALGVEPWQLKPGRRVPKDKDGWVGLQLTYPRVEKSGNDAIAILGVDQVIPKDMDGWVAVDRETLAKLGEIKQMGFVNEPVKPPIQDAGALKGKEVKPEPPSGTPRKKSQ